MSKKHTDLSRFFSDPEYRHSIKSKASQRFSHKGHISYDTFWKIIRYAGITSGILGLFFIVYFIYLISGLPSVAELENPKTSHASLIKSKEGIVLDKFFYENRTEVSYEEISPNVINALVATEDHRFYRHWGIDVYRLAALPFYVLQGKIQGGSTISMQLARNLYQSIGKEVTITRKLREMITAIQIERNYTKEEILVLYLNTVEFSNSAFGIESASYTHFGKKSSELTVPEAALLIGSLKGIYRYNPRINPERAVDRRNTVIQLMATNGLISNQEASTFINEPLQLNYNPPFKAGRESRFLGEFIKDQLNDWLEENGYDLYRDGLTIYTTIDGYMQEHALKVVKAQVDSLQPQFERVWTSRKGEYMDLYWRAFPGFLDSFIKETKEYKEGLSFVSDPKELLDSLKSNKAFVDSVKKISTRLEAGFMAIEPGTGHILAWVGGSDYQRVQFDHVYKMKRQPGSTFKPFVYAVAVEEGYDKNYKILKYPTSYRSENGSIWAPADNDVSGPDSIPMHSGLARSINNVTIRLLADISGNPNTDNLYDLEPGALKVVDMARRLGVNSQLEPFASIALGAQDVSLYEMVSAYATLANEGIYNEPKVILRVEDKNGNVLKEFGASRSREAISPETAYTMIDMMRGAILGADTGDGRYVGTATSIRSVYGIQQDIAGKTGTTNNSTDNWFIAMTPGVAAGAWVGGEDRRIRFPRGSSLGQGAKMALPIVGKFLQLSSRDRRIDWNREAFQSPDSLIVDLETDLPVEQEQNIQEN